MPLCIIIIRKHFNKYNLKEKLLLMLIDVDEC